MIAISPDATRIAFLANGQLFLRNLNETEARPVPGTNEGGFGPGSPVFSPDGQMVAYIHAVTLGGPYIVKRVPVAGGTPVTVFTSQTNLQYYEWGLTWPKSDTMMFVHSDGIARISANGGTPEVLVKRSEGEAFESPQILPGDDEVLFVRLAAQNPGLIGINAWDNAEIVIQSIDDNDPTVIWKGGSHARYLPTGHIIYARGNTLFALSIDLGSRKVTGGPVPVLEGIRRSSNGFTDAAHTPCLTPVSW
jgi:serine/threonine-protein kinase